MESRSLGTITTILCASHTCTTMNETLRNDKELSEFYFIFYLLRLEGGRRKRAVSKGEWGKVGVETRVEG